MLGWVVVNLLGFHRRSAGGVPGGVYERSGLFVCVWLSFDDGAST